MFFYVEKLPVMKKWLLNNIAVKTIAVCTFSYPFATQIFCLLVV